MVAVAVHAFRNGDLAIFDFVIAATLRQTAGAKNAAQSVAAITKSKIAKSPLRNA